MPPPPRFRASEIVRIRGERWRVVRCLPFAGTAIVEAQGHDADNRGTRASFLVPIEQVVRLPPDRALRVVGRRRWHRAACRTLIDADPSPGSLRSAAAADFALIPFQLAPALALVRGDACRFLIADAVGLGKTVQAGLMMAEILRRRPAARAIVVAPAGLRDQWHQELRDRFFLQAEVMDAAGVARAGARLPAGRNPWAVPPIVITSIDYVKRPEVMRGLDPLIWDIVVFDEAHGLCGRSDRAQAAAALASRGRAVVLLTATPHSGDDEAFRRLCGIGRLGADDPLIVFRRTRADAAAPVARRAVVLRVRPTVEERLMHDALAGYVRRVARDSGGAGATGAQLAMAVLRRRACSSAASLAQSLERRMALLGGTASPTSQLELPFLQEAQDAEPDLELAAPGLRDRDHELTQLGRILQLAIDASAAGESKLAAVARLIRRTGEPAIVFTEYRDTLRRIAAALARVPHALLHGDLLAGERRDALRRFGEGQVRVLLATDAASEGLNLHHRCRLVINLELPWTPTRLEQRVGRVDRIGQTRRVHAVHLLAAGTGEEGVRAVLNDRSSRVHAALGPATALPEGARMAAAGGEEGEVERLALLRRVRAGADGAPDEQRPVVAAVRRGARAVPGRCWAFRLVITDGDGRTIADTLVAAAGSISGRPDRARTTLRRLLEPGHGELQRVVARQSGLRIHEVESALATSLTSWTRREEAIGAALRAGHARLAATLLQRGLFDRRTERLSAQQQLLLDEALADSALRLEELAASRTLRGDCAELAFAILVR